jgi:hypothetical protein
MTTHWKRNIWVDFDSRRKIIHTILWIFYRKVLQRIQVIWEEDNKDSKGDEKVSYDFNSHFSNIRKSIKIAEDDWNKFKYISRQIFVGSWL